MRIPLTLKQARFLDSPAPFAAFVGGRGAGKSTIGAYKRIKRAKANRTYMIIAPTYPMLRDATLRTFKAMLRLLNRPFEESKGDGVITLLGNGAQFLLRTANDPDRLRGPNLSGAWGDEASLFDEEVFEIMIPALREAGEQGELDLTFTPKGKAHWTYKRFAGGNLDCELIHSHTSENPFLPPGFVNTIERQYGGGLLAQQELGGEFLDMGDTEWPSRFFEREDFFYTELPKDIKCTVLFYDGAGDPKARLASSKRRGDWHAAPVLHISNSGHLYFDVSLWRGSQNEAAARLADLLTTNPLHAAGMESDFGQSIMIPLMVAALVNGKGRPDLMNLLHGVPTGGIDKNSRIRTLGTYLMSGALHVRDNASGRETLRQFEQFPLCDHDDALDAMAGCVKMAAYLHVS